MSNALESMWGEGHAEKAIATGKRKQTILTPDYILEAIQKFWPDGIALDPCSEWYGSSFGDRCEPNVKADRYASDISGLEIDWPVRTFCNPPYGELKKWMQKSRYTWAEHIMLVPVRTHRKWFQLDMYDAVCFLDPVKFKGYKQAFPAPCCLLYRGPKTLQFAKAFKDFGRTIEP